MKVVIVGGVAGGATAAARIRRLNEEAEVVVFERSGYISYANCGLPYYIGDVITDSEELTLQTPESFFSRFHVDMKVRHEVLSIHPERKTVSVRIWRQGKNLKNITINYFFHREQDRYSRRSPGWDWKICLHCVQWKIRCESKHI